MLQCSVSKSDHFRAAFSDRSCEWARGRHRRSVFTGGDSASLQATATNWPLRNSATNATLQPAESSPTLVCLEKRQKWENLFENDASPVTCAPLELPY